MKLLDRVIAEIKEIAEKEGIHPSLVSKTMIVANGQTTDWELRKIGGLASVIKSYFPMSDKDLVALKDIKENANYIGKLEKQIASKSSFEDKLLEMLEANIKQLKVKAPKLKKSKKGKQAREVVVSLNDTHYGAIVRPEEVGGSNKFDWTEACRRTAYLAKQVAEYKEEKRHEVTKLHVILNGDLLQGAIHDLTARTAHLMAVQQTGAIHILTYFINYVSQFYDKIEVHGISGNHEDLPHRREGGRVTSHKYDSFITPVFYALSTAFRSEKRIKFNFPKGLYIDINLPGGRLLVTHGDTLFSKQLGNPASSLNVKGLSDVINRFNTGEISKGNPLVKMVLLGHVHNHINFTTFDGVKVYIAPSLSGIDSYAHSISINNNQVGQVIFESTEKHIMGDPRLVELTEADDQSDLDKIIPVYKEELEFV
jgi:Calcineurin-like phosphoesterase